MEFYTFVKNAQIKCGSTRDNIACIHNFKMKIPRTPEEVRGDFLRCNVLYFGDFVSRHIILVGIDNCAFKFVTSSFADGVRNVVAYAVGIRAVGHCNEQVVGLYKFDFVDCETAVNRYGSYCAEFSVVECLSKNDVCNVHVGISFLFQSVVMLMFDMSA